MSRSYKKYPTTKTVSTGAKKAANRRVRRYKKDLVDGNYYRKLFSSWDIRDYCWNVSWYSYWKEINIEWETGKLFWLRYLYRKDQASWKKENPNLHKRKHYGIWKKRFAGK